MPPHIAQLVAGHRDINTTMGYKAVFPAEIINGHRAFIARRRGLRPSEEYRVPDREGANPQIVSPLPILLLQEWLTSQAQGPPTVALNYDDDMQPSDTCCEQ